jgi:hypothetical protein
MPTIADNFLAHRRRAHRGYIASSRDSGTRPRPNTNIARHDSEDECGSAITM